MLKSAALAWAGMPRPSATMYGNSSSHEVGNSYTHAPRLVPPPAPAHEGVFVCIPIGGASLHRSGDLFPGLEAVAFERQGLQHLPPRLNQVEVGRIDRLIDEFPTGMMHHEEQQIIAVMDVQVVHDGVDALDGACHLVIHVAEKIDEVHFAA